MRTTKRIALGITAVVIGLSPATSALAGEGPQPADNGSTGVTIAPDPGQSNSVPVAINPGMTFHPKPADDDNQVKPELAIPVAPGVLTPDDDGQIDPSLIPGFGIEVVVPDDDPEDDGAIQVAPGNPPIPDWIQEMIDQAVAEALADAPAGQGTDGPTQVTVEVSAPAGNADSAQTDTEPVAAVADGAETSTKGLEPWVYGAGAVLAGMAVWALLALGARLAIRRN
ncbi:MAG: hypothetical protein OEM81_05920 [Acidimicrobiia bacterium]|nr:hypothetical protein [Acidimicrobiia bacterium]MDH3397356.1 hypothetical protein [Acidimicrobiia bacterium]